MKAKSIVVIGTLDTKGELILFLKNCIEERGHEAIVVDLSMGGEPSFHANITPGEIAQAGGKTLEEIRASRDRAMATQVMETGAIEKIRQLHPAGKIDGIIAIGGASMALMGSHIMKALPSWFGIPKIIVCPAAMPVYIAHWFNTMDIAVMQTVVDFAGLNDLVKNALGSAAGAICGMVEKAGVIPQLSKRSIAITQWGFSENCAKYVRQYLEKRGYTVYPFSANGISDRAMDDLIAQGYFDGVIDIAPGGVIEEIFEGNRAAGHERMEAAGKRGIPQVIAPSGVNSTGCGPTRKHYEKYAFREKVTKVDELRAGTRYNTEELKIGARAYAEKLNKANGPVSILIPLRGWSGVDREGSVLYDPEEDRVFVEELRRNITPEIEIEEIDCNLEDLEFGLALVEKFDKLMGTKGGKKNSPV